MRLGGVPLGEIRRRVMVGEQRVTRALLVELRGDVRAGARSLAADLERRRLRRAAESRRLTRMFRTEREYWSSGCERVVGVDEVGMGPLAGPVVAAAVILPGRVALEGLDDSKKLTVLARERLDREIRTAAVCLGLGFASRAEIDCINIYQAGLLAMRRAVEALAGEPSVVLVDARTIPGLTAPQRAVRGGDARVGSIAAASIVAKVHRDALMADLDRHYPGYGFAHNAGYGTAEHLFALRERGPTPQHRRSFAPVAAAERVLCRTSLVLPSPPQGSGGPHEDRQ